MISKADANTISVEPFKQPFVQLQRDSLLQVSQGNALLYSTRSSWTDVANTHPYPREKFVIVLKDGKIMEGMPVKVDPDDIVIKRGFATRTVSKSKIATVDYLRWNPPTDGFSLAVEEAPYALFLYPELYSRAVGLEGRIPVRLYDASKPEDDRVSGIKACP